MAKDKSLRAIIGGLLLLFSLPLLFMGSMMNRMPMAGDYMQTPGMSLFIIVPLVLAVLGGWLLYDGLKS